MTRLITIRHVFLLAVLYLSKHAHFETILQDYQNRVSSVVDEDLPGVEVTVGDPILVQVVGPYQQTGSDELGVNLSKNLSGNREETNRLKGKSYVVAS